MGLKVLGDKILVRPIVTKDKTAGGIVIPDVLRERQNKGKVLAVGTGWYSAKGERIETEARVGNVVLYSMDCGQKIEVDGETLVVLKEDEVLGIELYDATNKY